MNGSIKQEMRENQRLVVLRALASTNDGRLNETLIQRELDHFGYGLTRDEVRDVLRWLEERAAVEIVMAADVIMVATLTRRGEDHIERRGVPVEGIAMPSRR